MNNPEPEPTPAPCPLPIIKPGEQWRELQHTFHTSRTFMDYLHGDVQEEEASVACQYEYARESKTLWEAAQERDRLHASYKKDWQQVAHHVIDQYPNRWWGMGMTLRLFLGCPSFPQKDWQELTPQERAQLGRFTRTQKIPPLAMTDVYTLQAAGVLDQLTAMAKEATPEIVVVPPGQTGPSMKFLAPIVHRGGSLFSAVFDLDFSKGRTQLLKEFGEWLRLPEYQKLLRQYQQPKTGTTGQWLDRLKDLAAWRLYRELDNDLEAANHFANERRKCFEDHQEIQRMFPTNEQRGKCKVGNPRPFRDAKPKGGQLNSQSDLFCDEAEALGVKKSPLEFLTSIMPEDFPPPPGPEMRDAFAQIDALARP
jgi:hypothetical protein